MSCLIRGTLAQDAVGRLTAERAQSSEKARPRIEIGRSDPPADANQSVQHRRGSGIRFHGDRRIQWLFCEASIPPRRRRERGQFRVLANGDAGHGWHRTRRGNPSAFAVFPRQPAQCFDGSTSAQGGWGPKSPSSQPVPSRTWPSAGRRNFAVTVARGSRPGGLSQTERRTAGPTRTLDWKRRLPAGLRLKATAATMTWASFIALLLLDGRPDWRLRHRADLSGCIELHGMASSDGGVSFSDQETVATAHVTCLLPSPEGWRFETWPQQGTVDRVKCEYKYEQGQRGEGVMVFDADGLAEHYVVAQHPQKRARSTGDVGQRVGCNVQFWPSRRIANCGSRDSLSQRWISAAGQKDTTRGAPPPPGLDGIGWAAHQPLHSTHNSPHQAHASAATSYFWRRCGSGQAGRRWARRRSHVESGIDAKLVDFVLPHAALRSDSGHGPSIATSSAVYIRPSEPASQFGPPVAASFPCSVRVHPPQMAEGAVRVSTGAVRNPLSRNFGSALSERRRG
ncbi:hypothetical protein ACCO45_006036 [Purpureocillium lilacinum]|uniref:Uncharacterized protein n=1 Tax=Purpureocillium lilacinum TaxID=33203 RepID=A0ACC4DX47_PURLI